VALSEALAAVEAEVSRLDPRCLSFEDATRLSGLLAAHVKRCQAVQASVASRLAECDGMRGIARVAKDMGKTPGQVRAEIDTMTAAAEIPALAEALSAGEVSLAQGAEIAKTEAEVPGSVERLLETARREGLGKVKDEGRRIRHSAMDETELQAKRVAAREVRSFTDDLGMVNIHARLLPEDGMRILARLEAEAQRAWLDGDRESTVSQRLGDGLVRLVDGTGTARRGKTELVLVSHVDAVARGFALPDEPCHIVGGPRVGVDVVKQIARDALITTVLHDGVKIESLSRSSRSITPALRLLLEIGTPPDFLESVCVECGNRYRLQLNHINPYAAGGETSYTNLGRLCPPCHAKETAEQYAAGLLRGTPDQWKAGRDRRRERGAKRERVGGSSRPANQAGARGP